MWYQPILATWVGSPCCSSPFLEKLIAIQSPTITPASFFVGLALFAFWGALLIVVKTNLRIRNLLLLPQVEVPAPIDQLLVNFNLVDKVIVIDTEKPFVFCFGLLRPRICLSSGFIHMLSIEELRAAILHEAYHYRRCDPLRIFVVQVLAKTFFFLPVVAEWAANYEANMEILADGFAIQNAGKTALAGAILRFASISSPESEFAVPAISSRFSANASRIAGFLGYDAVLAPVSAKGLLQSSLALILICMTLTF